MKKFAAIIIAVLLFSTAACGKEIKQAETTAENATESIQTSEKLMQITISAVEQSEEAKTESDNGGGYIESAKYRQCYYQIPVYYIRFAGEEEYQKWINEVFEFSQDKCKMVSFVQYFDISKEDFEKINLQMAKDFVEWGEKPTLRPMDFENQQTYEIYNADIIYSFDDEIINEYYLTPEYPYCAEFEYEAAIESGEYTSQTEEWVDVEAMEAEIIAKYGEAEITEDVTRAQEESTVPEETETQTETAA